MDYFNSEISDCVKVIGVNTVATTLSFSDLENSLRVAGLMAAFLYTALKIAILIKNWNKEE